MTKSKNKRKLIWKVRIFSNICSLIQKLKLERIFVQNNQEEAIQLLAANFTKRVHDSLRNMDLKETYIPQAYAW